ncbi:MAG: nucleotidyltransferase domain-containing protein [Pseudomonadota bacterium]|nr:nucleotidyltransferase domain-containing protein [Pseudomonadota bacterium]
MDPDSIRVFGSVARGDARPDSDVDFLVHPLADCSLFDLGGMYMDCVDVLGREVNVVCDDGMKPRFARTIQDDVTPL